MKLEDIKKTPSFENKTNPAQPQQGLISKIICWNFGLLFLAVSLVIISEGKSWAPGLCCMFIGLILLPPFNNQLIKNGLVLTKGAKAGIIFVLLILIGAFSEKSDMNSQGASVSSSPAPTPARETAAVEVIKDSCLQVSNIFDAQSNLSDLQKDAVWKQKYKNKQFEWPMEVVEVSEGMLGGLTVQFKCQRSRSFVQDVQLSYPKEAKDTIMQFQKGSVYKVKGVLKMQTTLLGLAGDAVLN